MIYRLKVFLKDPWIIIPLAIAIAGQVFLWLYIFLRLGSASDQIFLHYNIIFGVDLVGEWWKILYLPVGGFMIILVNFFLSFFCYGNDKIISRLISFCAGIFELFIVWAAYLMVEINM